jgi:hypothetical protein
MGKPKRKKRKPEGYKPQDGINLEALLQEAEELIPALEGEQSGAQWGAIQKLLLKAKADSTAVARAVISRDTTAIEGLLQVLRDPDSKLPEETPEKTLPEVPDEILREAMKAFRKRMKLTKLDHESKIGRSPLTGGKDAEFDSILPPHQYAPEVWKILAMKGKLESVGKGFYKLPDQPVRF